MNFFAILQQYLGLALAGVAAAAAVPTASNESKKTAVLDTIAAVAGAVGTEATNPDVAGISLMIDVVATVFNKLVTPPVVAPATPAGTLAAPAAAVAPKPAVAAVAANPTAIKLT
jgi:hypothetical protein